MYEDYEDEYNSEPKEEKEIIEGYTVQTSVNIGNKRIIYAKDETEKMEMPYMKCIAIPNELFTRYEDAVISDSFEEIMKLFADDIKAEAIIIETENRARGANELPPFKSSDLIADRDECIEGKVVAINPSYLLTVTNPCRISFSMLREEAAQERTIMAMLAFAIRFTQVMRQESKDMKFSVSYLMISSRILQRQLLKN